MNDALIKRSPKLKLAVGWLAVQTALGVVFLFVLDVPAESKFVGIVVAALVAWVLYGVWNFRRWAKYPLIAMLILVLLFTAVDLPNLADFGSIVGFVLGLLYAAANAIAYDELKKATGINPPII
jgi:integral membrane sensor domain MASE1